MKTVLHYSAHKKLPIYKKREVSFRLFPKEKRGFLPSLSSLILHWD